MDNKTLGYARVSTKAQNLDRQIEMLTAYGVAERDIIQEKQSGKDFDSREAYQMMKQISLRSGDTLVVCSLDRLGRNKAQIKQELEYFKKNNIRVKVLNLPTTQINVDVGQEWVLDMVNNILIEVLGSMAEEERKNIKERQKQGIEVAKKKGEVKFGRPTAEKPANWDLVVSKWQNKEITAVQAMKELNLTKTTFYKLVKSEG